MLGFWGCNRSQKCINPEVFLWHSVSLRSTWKMSPGLGGAKGGGSYWWCWKGGPGIQLRSLDPPTKKVWKHQWEQPGPVIEFVTPFFGGEFMQNDGYMPNLWYNFEGFPISWKRTPPALFGLVFWSHWEATWKIPSEQQAGSFGSFRAG